MLLNPDNYHSRESDAEFMSYHQLRNWQECAAREAARQAGKYTPETSTAMLVGSYVDCVLLTPERFEAFKDAHTGDMFKKDKTLKADFLHADDMIARVKREPKAMKLLAGDHQWIVTGEIAGVPWRGLVDSVNPAAEVFVDLKTCGSCREKLWNNATRQWEWWYETWGYWRQLAVYQELIRQNYGKTFLPVLLAVSKEDPPDLDALTFEDASRLKEELDYIAGDMPQVMRWKLGEEPAKRCESCEWCRATREFKLRMADNRGNPTW